MPGIVQRLQSEFDALEIVTNGEVTSVDDVLERSTGLQGAMVGRDACRRPWHYSVVDEEVFGVKNPIQSRRALLDAYARYCDRAEVELSHDSYSPRRAVLKPALSCSTATRVPARSSGRSAVAQGRRGSAGGVLRAAAEGRASRAVLDAAPGGKGVRREAAAA